MPGGNISAVVLAAGEGKRFRSRLPKVLHEVAGRPLLGHVLAALSSLDLEATVVVASRRVEEIAAAMQARGFDGLTYAVQDPPRGTADAVRVGLAGVPAGTERVLVVSGDCPLLQSSTLLSLLELPQRNALLTAVVDDPSGYGRVLRDERGTVARIVEDGDARGAEREVREINAGVYLLEVDPLAAALERVGDANVQGELYLTDAIGELAAMGVDIAAVRADPEEVAGVNDRVQLAAAGAILRRRTCTRWMERGVTIVDPATTHIDPTVTLEPDVTVLPFTFLEGATTVGSGAVIGPQVRLVDTTVGAAASVTFAVAVSSDIGPEASVGPFASLRAGTVLARGARLGTFVESKATTLGEGSKANHLAYLGDATVGRGVNIGAGTITCNWDGRSKHPTVIEDRVYVGSDTMLVAPVHLGEGAATGAGSVVVRDVPPGSLAVGVPARMLPGRGNRMDPQAHPAGGGAMGDTEKEGPGDGDVSRGGDAQTAE